MRLDRRVRRRLKAGHALFVVLLVAVVGLLGWLTQVHDYRIDVTQAGRNTLDPASREILEQLERPVRVTAYVGPEPAQRKAIRDLFERYQRAGARLRLDFVNPETNPALARELGLRAGGELILRYGEREQRLQRLSEQTVTNALARLARERERWVVFLQGHGERAPDGDANFDLGRFAERLRGGGLRVQTHNLARTPYLPDNADLLVLASPRRAYLPGERARIRQYVQGGGNLLWLREPGTEPGLEALAADLGIFRYLGTVVDPAASLVGTERPDFAVISDYASHAAVRGVEALTLFPQASALYTRSGKGWTHTPLLQTRPESWTETAAIESGAKPDPVAGDTKGPLPLAVAATRGGKGEAPEQRVLVVGDGDFLSNAYLDNGANLELGLRLANWAVGEAAPVPVQRGQPADARLAMSRTSLMVLAAGFLFALPGLLLAAGAVVAWRRRRR